MEDKYRITQVNFCSVLMDQGAKGLGDPRVPNTACPSSTTPSLSGLQLIACYLDCAACLMSRLHLHARLRTGSCNAQMTIVTCLAADQGWLCMHDSQAAATAAEACVAVVKGLAATL